MHRQYFLDIQKEGFRILHLISSSGLLGAEHVLLELVEHSVLAGFKVTIGLFENRQNPNLELADTAAERGFEVRIFPCKGRFDTHTVRLINDYLVTANVRILHSHNYKSNFYAHMALKNHNARWVVTNHGRRLGSLLLLYNLLDLLVVRPADRVIAVSDPIARQLRFVGIDSRKICIIYNGVNWEILSQAMPSNSTRQSLGIKQDASVVGTVGSLSKEKGHAYLLEAAANVTQIFPNAVFLLIGNGRERKNLERTAYRLGVDDKVIFAGTRNDVPEILSILDVFVLPSLKEGLPMALLEAGAAGVPTIATRVGAIPGVVEDGVTGTLVPSKNSTAIANAIIRMLSDRNAASEMADNAFERVRDNYSSEKMAVKYLAMYKELLSQNKSRNKPEGSRQSARI
jgi:glycosyltransferase involved in cell wall biosynthesis